MNKNNKEILKSSMKLPYNLPIMIESATEFYEIFGYPISRSDYLRKKRKEKLKNIFNKKL